MKKVRFGVLGTSRVARKWAVPALHTAENAEPVMIGSRNVERARICSGELDVPQFGTYEDVLRSPEIDAVYICLPNALHEEWAIKTLRAGKHAWCEKPAALSYASAQRMYTAAKENDVRLMEGFMFLRHPQHERVRAMVAGGELGEILSFSGTFSYPMPAADAVRLNKTLGGGAFFDAAVYPIRASRFVFGQEPEQVGCVLVPDAQTGVDLRAEVTLVYPGERVATIISAMGGYFRSTYDVLGTAGYLRVQRAYSVSSDQPVVISLDRDDTVRDILIEPANQFRLMVEEFCREISLGATSTAVYESDLLAQAQVISAALKAHAEKRFVSLLEVDSDEAKSSS